MWASSTAGRADRADLKDVAVGAFLGCVVFAEEHQPGGPGESGLIAGLVGAAPAVAVFDVAAVGWPAGAAYSPVARLVGGTTRRATRLWAWLRDEVTVMPRWRSATVRRVSAE